MKTTLFFLLIMSIAMIASSQGRKTIKRNGVTERVEWKYVYEDGDEIKVKESYRKYDSNGNEIESIDYKDGKVAKHLKISYNQNNEPKEVIHYKPNGTVKKTVKYKYDGELKVEKLTYDSRNDLISKKVYEYTRSSEAVKEKY